MIVGVGIDLIEVARVRRVLEGAKTGVRFRARVYTEKEIDYCEARGEGKYQSYAGRFAAKEAVMKALGRGWGSKVGWLDIEILPALGGQPKVSLRNKTSIYAQELGIHGFSVSITHTKALAMAYVIAQSE